jgi:hypothetical protein
VLAIFAGMSRPDLERELERLSELLPGWAQWAANIPRGQNRWVRVPAGVALTVGGSLWFLPVVGLWMLPIGLATLAVDVPPMQRPMTRVLGYVNRRLEVWRGDGASDTTEPSPDVGVETKRSQKRRFSKLTWRKR